MVAKTVMVYSRQVIMIGHLILKMQSMSMLTEANGMFITLTNDKYKLLDSESYELYKDLLDELCDAS